MIRCLPLSATALALTLCIRSAAAFELTFDDGPQGFYAVAVGSAGEIIAAGTVSVRRSADELDFDDDGYLAAFDRTGQLLWHVRYGSAQTFDGLHSVVALAGGEFLLGGSTQKPGGSFLDSYCWVLRTNGARDVLWQKTFDAGSACRVTAMDVQAEGVAVIGDSGLVSRLALEDGRVNWWARLTEGADGASVEQLRTVNILPGGEVVVGATLRYESADGSSPAGIWAPVIGDAGALISAQAPLKIALEIVGSWHTAEGVRLVAMGDGGLALFDVDATGEWANTNSIALSWAFPQRPKVQRMHRNADGSLVLAGSVFREPAPTGDALGAFGLLGAGPKTEGWVLKLAPNGTKSWEAAFGSADFDDSINGIVALPNGSYAIAGERGTGGINSSFSGWLFTVDANGQTD